jgi:hypothetical protein
MLGMSWGRRLLRADSDTYGAAKAVEDCSAPSLTGKACLCSEVHSSNQWLFKRDYGHRVFPQRL